MCLGIGGRRVEESDLAPFQVSTVSYLSTGNDSILQYRLSVPVSKLLLHRWIKSPDQRTGVVHQYPTYICVICPRASGITDLTP